MKEEGGSKQPEPGETLDAPGYEPPRKRVPVVPIAVIAVAGMICIYLATQAGPCIVIKEREVYTKTGVLVHDLQLACENFRLEYGQYPWVKVFEVTASTEIRGHDVYVELRGLAGAKINTKTDYLGEVRKEFLKNGVLVDTWGHEIRFRVNFNGLQAVIWSCGKNGIDETNDGETPDPPKYPKGYYWFGSGDTGDDIGAR